MQRHALNWIVQVVLAFAVAVGLAEMRPAAATNLTQAPRAKLSPESSAHSILMSAFESSGWSVESALIHANNAMARLGIEGYTPSDPPASPQGNPKPGHSLLSPGTNVHATILEAFLASGWDITEAIAHTEHALVKEGMEPNGQTTCQVRRVTIQYCEGGQVKYYQGYLAIACYWQLFPPAQPELCDIPQCLGGQVPWFTMHTTSGCSIGFTGCVRVHFKDVITVRCSNTILECSCFQETTCEDITDVECCPPLELSGSGGCQDCPCT